VLHADDGYSRRGNFGGSRFACSQYGVTNVTTCMVQEVGSLKGYFIGSVYGVESYKIVFLRGFLCGLLNFISTYITRILENRCHIAPQPALVPTEIKLY